MKPILSIIIPVYNTEKYLDDCIISCLDCEYDTEIVCINDGSSDGSLALLKKYAEKHGNIVVIDQPNSGVSSARNNGLRHATGKYILFLDSDDFIQPGSLTPLMEFAQKENTDAVLFDYVKKYGKVSLGDIKPLKNTIFETISFDDRNTIRNLEQRECFGFACRYIFKREYLQKYDVRFIEGMIMAEDRAFLYFALMNITYLPWIHLPVFVYRQRGDSAVCTYLTTNREKYIDGKIKCVHFIREYLSAHNLSKDISDEIKTEMYGNLRGAMMLVATEGDAEKCSKFLQRLTSENLYPEIFHMGIKHPHPDFMSNFYNIATWLFGYRWYVMLFCRACGVIKKFRKK